MTLILLSLLAACGGDATTSDSDLSADSGATDLTATDTVVDTGPAQVHTLSVQELKAWLDEGKEMLLINVHVPHAGEIPGTDSHVPYNQPEELVAEIGDLERLTVVYCLTGPMSAAAAQDLVDLGHRQVFDLPEAMVGWEAAGYALSD